MDREFIEFLVKNDALKFGEFTLKSGRIAPYFVNTGVFFNGENSYELGKFYAKKIDKMQNLNAIYGPAYKGIPLAVSTAIALKKNFNKNLNWIFDRKEKKIHGDKGAFVGAKLDIGSKVVIVDDVITTGATKVEAIEKIDKALGAKVVGIVISVDREERGLRKSAIEEFTDKTGVPIYPIVKISEVFEYLKNREINGKVYVTDKIYAKYLEYKKEYGV